MTQIDGKFSVSLVNEDRSFSKTISVAANEFILDIAQDRRVDLPYSCLKGCCTTCVGKVIQGKVDQTEQALRFLSRDQIEAGYVLTCVAYPLSDCKILTHQEDELF